MSVPTCRSSWIVTVGLATLVVLLAGCAPASDRASSRERASSQESGHTRPARFTDVPVRTSVHPAVPAIADPALRAAWIATRQAEGAANPEYAIRGGPGRWAAFSAPWGMAVDVRAARLSVRSDTAARGPGWVPASIGEPVEASLELKRWGWDESLSTVPGVDGESARANRLELDRGSALSEWYVNGALGLEQGFSVAAPPAGAGDQLVLELAVEGLEPAATDGSIELIAPDGATVARYAELFVQDARGEPLRAVLAARPGAIRIEVAVADATFPIDVDPMLWLPQAKLLPLGPQDPILGESVVLLGSTALVGAPGAGDDVATGAAYVFSRVGSSWTLDATLLAADGVSGDRFGTAVALSGDTAVIGAPEHDDQGSNAGAAYVFVRSGTTWTEQQKLRAGDGQAGATFGRAVAVSGDTVLVGSPVARAAYAWKRTGTTWTEQQKLSPIPSENGFGSAVAISGDEALVGSLENRVRAYSRTGTTWTNYQALSPQDASSGDEFGLAIAMDASGVALIGSSRDDDLGTDSGSVYAFVRSGTTWAEQWKMLAADGVANDRFGYSLALSGTTALIGASAGTFGNGYGTGFAYVFVRAGTTWVQETKLPRGTAGYSFGTGVGLDGDDAFVGVTLQNHVRSYSRSGTTWSGPTSQYASRSASDDYFGYAASLSGNTLVVGLPGDDDDPPGCEACGSAQVFVRAAGTWVRQQVLPSPGVNTNDGFGTYVSVSGDTLVVGRNYGSGTYVYTRSGTTWSPQATLPGYVPVVSNDTLVTRTGDVQVHVRVGTTWTQQQALGVDINRGPMALEGDTLVLGVPIDSAYTGAVLIYVRSGTTWTLQQRLTASDGAPGDQFGSGLGLQGDTVIVGAPDDDDQGAESGSAYVFVRTGTTWALQQKLLPAEVAMNDHFGGSVTLIDEKALVGAYYDDDGGPDAGAVYAFARSGAVWTQTQKLISPLSNRLGWSATSSGDTVVFGADRDFAKASNAGAAYVYVFQDLFAAGSPCSVASTCASGSCVDGYCCNTACNTPCRTCAAIPGSCTPVTSADDPDSCAGASTCDATGACAKDVGLTCALPWECASGFCADGRCCSSACSGGCDVCNVVPGTCTVVAAGTAGAGPSCAPYLCDGVGAACPVTCSADSGCANTHYCGAAGICVPRKGAGAACNPAAGADCRVAGCRNCSSSNCVDGYCCDGPCSGACNGCRGADLGWAGAFNGTCANAPAGFIGEPPCGTYACNGAAPTCATNCTSDLECGPLHYCAVGGSCQPRKAQGQACNAGAGADCLVGGCRVCSSAGGCVDGFCCSASCSGACDVCAAALGASTDGTCTPAASGSAGVPSCAPFLCDGSSSVCATTCSSDAECAAAAFCGPGGCTPDLPVGGSCTSGSQCLSGFCVDGVCCSTACGGLCQACAASLKEGGGSDGTCGAARAGTDPRSDCAADPASTCQQDGSCNGASGCRLYVLGVACGATACTGTVVSGQVCTGTGTCQADPGGLDCAPYACGANGCASPCSSPGDCVGTHFCAVGSCEPKRVDGAACAAAGECVSGFCVDGVCCGTTCDGLCRACAASLKAPGAGPDGTCGPAAAGTDPHGGCADRPRACVQDPAGRWDVIGHACDGAGACSTALAADCGEFNCAGTDCATSCAGDADCSDRAYCIASSCVPKKNDSASCATAQECGSGYCVDGYCCDGPCSGQCEACDVAQAEGKCVAVLGAPHAGRPACEAASGSDPCGARECDGTVRAGCAGFVLGLSCREASCNAGIATLPESCNGSGACPGAKTSDCGAFACSGTGCATSCDDDDDCGPKFLCDTATSECVARDTARCVDDFTLRDPNGVDVDCLPYRCEGEACLDTCARTTDCSSSYVCDPDTARCVQSAPTATDDGGCGCRAPGSAPRSTALSSLLVIAGALWRAGKRRRRHES